MPSFRKTFGLIADLFLIGFILHLIGAIFEKLKSPKRETTKIPLANWQVKLIIELLIFIALPLAGLAVALFSN